MATRVTSIETGQAGDGRRMTGFARLAELHSALADEYADLARQESGPPSLESRGPELLRIKEACERMRWTYSWAVKHWATLGGFRDADGKLKIPAAALARWTRPSAEGGR